MIFAYVRKLLYSNFWSLWYPLRINHWTLSTSYCKWWTDIHLLGKNVYLVLKINLLDTFLVFPWKTVCVTGDKSMILTIYQPYQQAFYFLHLSYPKKPSLGRSILGEWVTWQTRPFKFDTSHFPASCLILSPHRPPTPRHLILNHVC